jgi:hypothetical protein
VRCPPPLLPQLPLLRLGATSSALKGAASTLEVAPSADSPPSAAPSSSPTYSSDDSCLDNDHDDAPLRYCTVEDLLSEPHPGLKQVEFEEAELMLTNTGEPCSFAEAEREEAWRAEMRDEINSVVHRKTWELVNLPAGH